MYVHLIKNSYQKWIILLVPVNYLDDVIHMGHQLGKWKYKKFSSCVPNTSVTVAMSLFWFWDHQNQPEDLWPVPCPIKRAGCCSTMSLDLCLVVAWFDSFLGHCLTCLGFSMTCLSSFRQMLACYFNWTMTTLKSFQCIIH